MASQIMGHQGDRVLKGVSTSTAARLSEMDLHFVKPSLAALTTSGIYFSNDNEDISFNRAL
jgi:hypothetical protein